MAGPQEVTTYRKDWFKPFRHSENSGSAVLFNSQLGEFFKSTVSVHQECSFSSILFNLFRQKIMQEALHDYCMYISTGGRPIN